MLESIDPRSGAAAAAGGVVSRDLDALEDEIAILSAHMDAATYRLLVCIREFDRAEGWSKQGARSCAHWLNWRVGLDLGAAREKVRVAWALERLPNLSDKLRRGAVSYAKVRAITRIATPETEDVLLEVAEYGTASHVEKLVRAYRRSDNDGERATRQHELRQLTTYFDDDGMLVIRGRLPPEQGAMVMRAIEAACEELRAAERAAGPVTASDVAAETSEEQIRPENQPPLATPDEADQRRADALAMVAQSALASQLAVDSSADRHQIVLHVDATVLADPTAAGRSEVEGGTHVSAETSRRLACDAGVVVMTHGADGSVLDVGRKTRQISPALRRALCERDRGCRFPGCTNRRYVDGHHIKHWANGGETKLDNLVELCRLHHRLIHEGGFRMETMRDGGLAFYAPGDRLLCEQAPPTQASSDPVNWLSTRHAELRITPQTGFTRWNGEKMSYSAGVEMVRTAAHREKSA